MEIVVRASIMFLIMYGLLRLMGKRELGQMAPFELVTLIVMGDLIQQGVTHQDFSLTGAMLAIVTFAGWSLAFAMAAHHLPRARRWLESGPVVLVRAGQPIRRNMNAERIDADELASQVRLAGMSSLDEVAWAILEPDGHISFIRRDEARPDTRAQESGPAG